MASAIEHHFAVHKNVFDSPGVLMRLFPNLLIHHSFGVEYRDVGPDPRADETSVVDADFRRVG